MSNSLESKEFNLLGLGEVMMRLSPPDRERIAMGESFDKTVGGSELNVMCGAALLGIRTGIITKIPDNQLGTFVRHRIRNSGVSDDFVVDDKTDDARLGLYYYEYGAYPRKPSVIYDRRRSSFSTLTEKELPGSIYNSADTFHVSGITLGLGKRTHELTLNMIKRFKENGTKVSFDVNYRAALWSEEEAKKSVDEILPFIDYLFISEETSRRLMQRTGTVEEILRSFSDQFGISNIAMTKRDVISPTRHSWSSAMLSGDVFCTDAPYENIDVIDRIGSGDAYVAGVLAGLLSGETAAHSLDMGNAMAAIKNTVVGDMPVSSRKEIEQVIAAHKGERQSELNR